MRLDVFLALVVEDPHALAAVMTDGSARAMPEQHAGAA
jgi:hypothetical protein